MRWFTRDGFKGSDGVWGGDLVDTMTPAAGRDKVQHAVLGAFLFLLLSRWTTLSDPLALAGVAVVAAAWEVAEFTRYRRWQSAGAPSPWPFAADLMSWRDVVATVAGATLALAIF